MARKRRIQKAASPNYPHTLQGIRRLVKGECAGYQAGGKDSCPARDTICVYFNQEEEVPRCAFFEKAVLPLDRELELWYLSEYINSTERAQAVCPPRKTGESS